MAAPPVYLDIFSSLRKQTADLAGGWASSEDPLPPLPSPATSADGLAGYITFTNSFLFSSLLF